MAYQSQFVRRSTYSNLEMRVEIMERKLEKIKSIVYSAIKSPETTSEALKKILETAAH